MHLDRRGGWGLGLPVGLLMLGGGALGCGDDAPMQPGGSTGDASTGPGTTMAPDASETVAPDDSGTTGDSSEGTTAATTGLDSTGPAGASSSGGDSSSSGEPLEPPTARDDVYFVREDMGPLMVAAAAGLLSNDEAVSGGALMVDAFDAVSTAGGTVDVMPDGALEYTPPAGFFGNDTFTYSVREDMGGTAPARVTVTVGPLSIGVDEVVGGMGGFVIDGAAAGDASGFDVSGGGDVDGDGLDDLLVSSVNAAGGAGRVWVVFGKPDGGAVDLAAVSMGAGGFEILGEAAGDEAGHEAAIVGDATGDGLADIVVGAPLVGTAGTAYLVHGKADGAAVDLADVALGLGGFSMAGAGFGEDAGTSVAGAGDVDGDGLADMVIGAPEGGPFPGGGRAYVVFGMSGTAPVQLSDVYIGIGGFAMHGVGFDDNAGMAVAGAGDVNGDGRDDVIVGAPVADAGGMSNAGRSYVVFGRNATSGIDLSMLGGTGFFIDGASGSDLAGTAVAGVGDVDGDGRADVVVGAPQAEDALVLQGQAYVVRGKTDGATVSAASVAAGMGGFVIDGELAGNFLGTAVGGGGDVDGDGYGDVLLGVPNVAVPGPTAGRGYVVFGRPGGASVPLADLPGRLGGFSVHASAGFGRLGWRVADAGDVNGDGFDDVIFSATFADPPAGNDAGRSYVVFGGNFSGAATHLGTDAADVIVGTAGIDVIVAGAEADEIHGEGGSDVIRAGAGDDFIGVLDGALFRVDGGSGQDTLAFEDGGVQLHLEVVNDAAIRDIEVFDITGTGDNLLSLGLRDLRAIVGSSRTLRVEGDAGDTVDADLTGGDVMDLGVAGGIHRYGNGVLTLELAEALGGAVML